MKHSTNISTGTEKTSYLDKCWVSIEQMPIHNWQQILKTGDLKFIFKSQSGRVSKRIGDLWLELQQQYIDEFGLDEHFKKLLRLQKKLIRLRMDYVITGDRFLLNLIKITERDIDVLNQGEAAKFYDQLDAVEKYKGFAIDPNTFTVIKWYYALKNMSKHGETDSGE